MNTTDYQCEICQGIFGTVNSDEEAIDEYVNSIFYEKGSSLSIVCDDCYKDLKNSIENCN